MGMKTAYIEFNATNQIRSLGNSREAKSFRYKGITFFPNASVTSLTEILQYDFQYYIVDMGVLTLHTVPDFLRCDKSFLISSPGKWRICQTQEKIDYLFKKNQNQMTVIMNLRENESKQAIFSIKEDSLSFPFVKNPFHIEPSQFHSFSQILERNYLYTGDILG